MKSTKRKQIQPIEETHSYNKFSTVEFTHFQKILSSFIYSFFIIAFLCMHSCSSVSTQTCLILCNLHGLQPARLFCPQNFPGKSTGVGCHFPLQRIFPTQGSNPGLPCFRQTLYRLSHQGSLYIQKQTINVERWCCRKKQNALTSCSPDSGCVVFLLIPCPKYLNLPHLFFPTVFEIDVIRAS